MAKVFIEESTLVAISDAIRAKTGKTDLMEPSQWTVELDNAGGSSSGQYLWSKKESADGDVIGYAVADDSSKYPNGGFGADGYYWELVGKPVTLISFTVTCTSTNIIKTYQAEEGMTWSDWLSSKYADTSPSGSDFGTMSNGVVTAVNGSSSNLNRLVDSFGMYFGETEEIYANEQYIYTGA